MANVPIVFFQSLTTSSTLANGKTITFPLASDKAKGCGYFGQTDAMHTVQFSTVTHFNGLVKIQATLATDPQEADWFDVHGIQLGDGITPVPDATTTMNFTGNFVWVRAYIVSMTAGELNRILFTHN